VYVMPVLAYPGLLGVTVNGKPSECIPVPRNDRAFCGLRLVAGTADISIVFRGFVWANDLSIAAGVIGVAILMTLELTRRRTRTVAS
jgi:hypothetical protein